MGKTAIVLGATGLTGGNLLQALLKDRSYSRIVLFSRSTCGIKHAKITEYLIDLFELDNYKTLFLADVVFCCIGTTKSKTPNKAIYHNIDYGIPLAAANLCLKNNIETFICISALGADAKSKVFYNRTKGEMEAVVLSLKIKNTYMLQPSLIVGGRNEFRLGEYLGKILMRLLSPLFIGKLNKYKPIESETIVSAMLWLAEHTYELERIPSEKIKEIAIKYDRNRT
ncbi:nucleoside-diphosphate-sugar epimerase [Formosa agariphila KMM 3901]|uniref:Nucleoside-diphosphate-sugar epimerase n=1 Tax=Formosa agariphila (strain DSM 15362 / KCTC 12365 / LMG 23005 / KMM 3901 / M-2Alg 35-1) TaxID=1347342 RepID=T2KRG1_FORAG|nr:NAD-dependent epimerase/dehydratase family protein [Formosa agariphila]CDF81108.1 nucleoside-diphosphate-sugar epimerase [Formosa agariphila KMM 3901]